MTKRALITGITGQDGSLPRRAAAREGLRGHRHGAAVVSTENFERIAHLQDRIDARPGRPARPGLADRRCCTSTGPHEVYNLAAQSFVPTRGASRCSPASSPPSASPRMLEAIRIVDPEIRFYQASSSRDVRQGREDVPQTRDDAVLSASPVRRRQGLRPLHHRQLPRDLRPATPARGILFNHESPAPRARVRHAQGQRTASPASSWACRTTLALGNLDAKRDWGFAGDYVEAMWLHAPAGRRPTTTSSPPARPTPSASSARSRSPASASTGRSTWSIDERFFRPAEVDLLIGDPAKAHQELGWKPKVPLPRARRT